MSKKEIFALQNGSDIRGIAMDGVEGEKINLTPEVTAHISAAFAHWLSIKKHKPMENLSIGIGRDSRITGPFLEVAASQGLAANKVRVVHCGLATTPAMFMSTVFGQTHFDGAIMITASHLPFNRNGLKFFDCDGCLDHEDINIVLEMAAESKNLGISLDEKNIRDYLQKSAQENYELIRTYSAHLRSAICSELECDQESKPLQGLKIVVDSGNGASGFFVDSILKFLGADTTGSQYLEPDGHFPNHIPNPEDKSAMQAVREATLANHADLGLIFDTDVDRMSAVLEDGTEVNRDAIIALISAILAPQNPGSTIVTDSVTSDRLTRFLEEKLGLVHLRYMRGYKNVINLQKELNQNGTNCPLAMETSGHGALKENYYLDDGAYLAVKIIAALARERKKGNSLASLIRDLPPATEEYSHRYKINCQDFESYGKSVLKEFRKRAEEKGYTLPKSYEGVRISFTGEDAKGWVLLRMSLHDPVMPLNMEGERPGDVEKLKKITQELLAGFDKLE